MQVSFLCCPEQCWDVPQWIDRRSNFRIYPRTLKGPGPSVWTGQRFNPGSAGADSANYSQAITKNHQQHGGDVTFYPHPTIVTMRVTGTVGVHGNVSPAGGMELARSTSMEAQANMGLAKPQV
jgi:hypothetical protein